MVLSIDTNGYIIATKGNLCHTLSTTIDLSQAARGIYFVRVLDEQGKVYTLF